MKYIFLVKINPNERRGKDNYAEMTRLQYERFIATKEGQLRKKNFIRIDPCEEEDQTIVAEVEPDEAADYIRQRNHANYCKQCEEQQEFLSFDGFINDSGESVLADDYCLEDEIITDCMIETLRKVLSELSEDEKELIQALFLDGKSDSEYARIKGLKVRTVNSRKFEIIKKLRSKL